MTGARLCDRASERGGGAWAAQLAFAHYHNCSLPPSPPPPFPISFSNVPPHLRDVRQCHHGFLPDATQQPRRLEILPVERPSSSLGKTGPTCPQEPHCKIPKHVCELRANRRHRRRGRPLKHLLAVARAVRRRRRRMKSRPCIQLVSCGASSHRHLCANMTC